MRRLVPALAVLAALAAAGCASRTEAPACRGEAFPLNPVEAPR